jgi:hypothetical protein
MDDEKQKEQTIDKIKTLHDRTVEKVIETKRIQRGKPVIKSKL